MGTKKLTKAEQALADLSAKVDILAARLGIDFEAIAADEAATLERGAEQSVAAGNVEPE